MTCSEPLLPVHWLQQPLLPSQNFHGNIFVENQRLFFVTHCLIKFGLWNSRLPLTPIVFDFTLANDTAVTGTNRIYKNKVCQIK